MKSAKRRRSISFRQAVQTRREHELAFLPAALEIVETPPSPIGRAIGADHHRAVLRRRWPGRAFGKVDIVATAPGKIVPSGRTKVIQPFETGVVRAIHVRDGQSVKAGDVLIELDPTMNEAEREHLQSDLVGGAARRRPARGGAVPGTPIRSASFKPPPRREPPR